MVFELPTKHNFFLFLEEGLATKSQIYTILLVSARLGGLVSGVEVARYLQ
jgi:hypothetical protein